MLSTGCDSAIQNFDILFVWIFVLIFIFKLLYSITRLFILITEFLDHCPLRCCVRWVPHLPHPSPIRIIQSDRVNKCGTQEKTFTYKCRWCHRLKYTYNSPRCTHPISLGLTWFISKFKQLLLLTSHKLLWPLPNFLDSYFTYLFNRHNNPYFPSYLSA